MVYRTYTRMFCGYIDKYCKLRMYSYGAVCAALVRLLRVLRGIALTLNAVNASAG